MIPIPKLDTRSFKDIYEKLRRLADIGGETDLSYQDPGQTLLELFALLFDMQNFYMDFIGEEHREKYARMLGVSRPGLSGAETLMEISGEFPWRVMPEGFPLGTANLPFEASERIMVSENTLVSVMCGSRGECEWLLGFAEDLKTSPVWRVHLQTDFPLEPVRYPIYMWKCEYLSAASVWKEAEGVSGRITNGYACFTVSEAMEAKDGLFWIRLTLDTEMAELIPALECAKINVLKARQRETLCYYTDTRPIDGISVIEEYFGDDWRVEALGITENGYTLIDDAVYSVSIDKPNGQAECNFTKPPANCRLLCFRGDFAQKRVYKTDGTPNYSIRLPVDNVDGDSVEIQCGREIGGVIYWEDWTRVDNFDASLGTDKHFIVKDGEIRFGEHERGDVPPKGFVKIISCAVCLGAKGNIRKSEARSQYAENIVPSSGGADRSGDPLYGVAEDFEKLYKAVTAEDYERILDGIPVLKLDRVRAVCEDLKIVLYIKPMSRRMFPVLNDAYRRNILSYLEPYRIITTQIEVKSAEYVAFSLELFASFDPRYDDCETLVIDEIAAVYPYRGFNGGPRRPFGEKISYGEIYKLISGIACVREIKSLSLILHGNESDDEVNFISLLPGQLAYIKEIRITWEENRQLW